MGKRGKTSGMAGDNKQPEKPSRVIIAPDTPAGNIVRNAIMNLTPQGDFFVELGTTRKSSQDSPAKADNPGDTALERAIKNIAQQNGLTVKFTTTTKNTRTGGAMRTTHYTQTKTRRAHFHDEKMFREFLNKQGFGG